MECSTSVCRTTDTSTLGLANAAAQRSVNPRPHHRQHPRAEQLHGPRRICGLAQPCLRLWLPVSRDHPRRRGKTAEGSRGCRAMVFDSAAPSVRLSGRARRPRAVAHASNGHRQHKAVTHRLWTCGAASTAQMATARPAIVSLQGSIDQEGVPVQCGGAPQKHQDETSQQSRGIRSQQFQQCETVLGEE